MARWRIETSSRFTSSSTASVVCTMETPVCALSIAWMMEAICARICSEIINCAGASAARTILSPEDKCSRVFFIRTSTLSRLRWALNAWVL